MSSSMVHARVHPAEVNTLSDREAFFRELTKRNHHFISPSVQRALRRLKVLIAGCGSTGGACIESLARVGVEHFALADNGSYELNNLNRQHAFLDDLGKNKAEFHAESVLGINPYAEVRVHSEGITPRNAQGLVAWADIVMDAVDVTTASGIQMKIALHEVAHLEAKPVLTALDLGFCQYGRSYDYRDQALRVLDGKVHLAAQAQHPLKILFSLVPLSVVPAHCLPLVKDLLLNRVESASQLGCTSDLLSSIIVPTMIRFAAKGEVIPGWNMDLAPMAHSVPERLLTWLKGIRLRHEIRGFLKSIP